MPRSRLSVIPNEVRDLKRFEFEILRGACPERSRRAQDDNRAESEIS